MFSVLLHGMKTVISTSQKNQVYHYGAPIITHNMLILLDMYGLCIVDSVVPIQIR